MGIYRPPGVYAQEEVRTIIPSPIPNNDAVAIVSEVPPATPFAQRLALSGLGAFQLEKKGIVTGSIKIFNREETVEYLAGEDFLISSSGAVDYNSFKSVTRVENEVEDEAFTLDSGTQTYTPINNRGVHNYVLRTEGTTPKTYVEFVDFVYDRYAGRFRRLDSGTLPIDGTEILLSYNYGIANNEEVLITYNYSDVEYYSHHLLNDVAEVYGLFGPSWLPDGTINPMALMASIVFANGGPQTQVLCVPVNPHAITVTKTDATLAEWQLAFDSIAEDEVSMILETSGEVSTHGYLISHVLGASAYNQERMGFLGRDGVVAQIPRNDLRNYAAAINNQRIVLASPSRFLTENQNTGQLVYVGGQYGAAALTGRITVGRVQDTLTRKPIFAVRTSAPEAEPLLTGDTAKGLCVIENRSGFMRVRHGVTTMFADVNQREISVVRAKDFLIKSLRDVLDKTVIGMLMEPDVDFLVQGAATNVLDRMKNAYVIADYNAPQCYQDRNDPTRLILRFTYLPNYPVNEILIQFGISSFGSRVLG
jgi:hypothetical protein